MKRFFKGFAFYGLLWMMFFIAVRALFLLVQFREMILYSPWMIARTFIHGAAPDLSATAYIMVLPLILFILSLFIKGKWFVRVFRIWSALLIIAFSALALGDAIVYSYWGFRLEFFIVEYLKTPGDAAASATAVQIVMFITSLILLAGVFIRLSNKLIDKFFLLYEPVMDRRKTVPALILLALFLVIPARGGIAKEPVSIRTPYFSDNLFPSHAAVNIVWNFISSALNGSPDSNPYMFHSEDDAREDFQRLLSDDGITRSVLINNPRPNILLIILESFGSTFTDSEAGWPETAPEFRKLIPEGIYFSNIYSSGSRTDKVLPSIFNGYPNLPEIQVIREDDRIRSMPGIIKMLDSAGYKTSFWYGGDINFANINSFIRLTGFSETVSRKDFSRELWDSKWGVHDGTLFTRLLDSLKSAPEPFAYSALTLSSHEPFDVPMDPVFSGNDPFTRFRNSIYYTDRSLGKFIESAKQSEWWKNTLVIITGDHCRRNSVNLPVYSEEIFRVPVLWTGGAVEKPGLRIEKYGNQFDIPKTIAAQAGLSTGSFIFGKDLLSEGSQSFAFYTYHEGFAIMTDTSRVVYDIRYGGNLLEWGKDPRETEKLGKSFLQILYDDYLSR